jgi:hypothetical protein
MTQPNSTVRRRPELARVDDHAVVVVAAAA